MGSRPNEGLNNNGVAAVCTTEFSEEVSAVVLAVDGGCIDVDFLFLSEDEDESVLLRVLTGLSRFVAGVPTSSTGGVVEAVVASRLDASRCRTSHKLFKTTQQTMCTLTRKHFPPRTYAYFLHHTRQTIYITLKVVLSHVETRNRTYLVGRCWNRCIHTLQLLVYLASFHIEERVNCHPLGCQGAKAPK